MTCTESNIASVVTNDNERRCLRRRTRASSAPSSPSAGLYMRMAVPTCQSQDVNPDYVRSVIDAALCILENEDVSGLNPNSPAGTDQRQ